MKKILVTWIALLLTTMAEPDEIVSELLPLPADGIYDPDGWLENDAAKEMVEMFQGARRKGNTTLYVVILSEAPGGDVERYVRKFGKAWAQESLWGMVCHVPGDDSYPKFFGGINRTPSWTEQQLLEFQDSINRALAEASRRVESQDDGQLKVKSGAQVMADEFGYLGLVMERIDQSSSRASIGQVVSDEPADGGWLILVVVPVVILSAAIIVILLRRKTEEEESDDYLFPETEPCKRFQAPWSGGGNVLIRFESPTSDDELEWKR